jgi:hypothetical protein
MELLVSKGLVDERNVLTGMPHPSGANAERIAYFLGTKRREYLSIKTNADLIDASKVALVTKVSNYNQPSAN